jgi:hypothetical protein
MERRSVDSSAVASVGYNPSRQVLALESIDGDVYQCFDVPAALYQALLDSRSIGQFVNMEVKSVYRYEKL